MKTTSMIRKLPLDVPSLRQVAGSIGIDLAHGRALLGEVIRDLALRTSEDDEVTTYLRALRDVLGAYLSEQAAMRRDAALAAMAREPIYADLLQRLARGD